MSTVSPGRVTQWIRFTDGVHGTAFGKVDGDLVVIHEGDLFSASEPSGEQLPLDSLNVIEPCQPTKFIALCNNSRAVAERRGWTAPKEPLYVFKSPSCVNPHRAQVARPASYSGRIIFEGELGVVIGKTCVDVAIQDVDSAIFGYTCVNDVTALDLIDEDSSFPQWTRAKSFDTFGALGPVLASGLDPDALRVTTSVGGRTRQDYLVSDLFFSPRQLVSLISRGMTLSPGDVIACGTSSGALPMRPGIPVDVNIAGIGLLSNALAD